jgi:hypothetical protein
MTIDTKCTHTYIGQCKAKNIQVTGTCTTLDDGRHMLRSDKVEDAHAQIALTEGTQKKLLFLQNGCYCCLGKA